MQTCKQQGFPRIARAGGWIIRAVRVVLVFIPLFMAQAAYLEQDEIKGRPIPVVDPPITNIRPIPDPATPFRNLVNRLEIGKPSHYRHLTVYPLILRRGSGSAGIRTLDEAIAHDWIVLREQDTARVPEILARNKSKYPVFLMAGEMLAGGRQNRFIRNDTLLSAFSEFIPLPVYCGEKARWAGSCDVFSSSKDMVDHNVRKMAVHAETQDGIWREIDNKLEQGGVVTPTRAYQRIYEDRAIDKELRTTTSEFKRVMRRDTVGVVLVTGDRIVCCDLFSDPDLFARLRDKIIRSYALENVWKGGLPLPDGIERPGEATESFGAPGVDRQAIRNFLDRALQARARMEPTPGEGQFMRLQGAVSGSVLVWRDEVVHAGIFVWSSYEHEGEWE